MESCIPLIIISIQTAFKQLIFSAVMEDCSDDAKAQLKSKALFNNFILFCVLYAVVHSTVNVVTAFASAELGIFLGAFGGFAFFGGFTISSLVLAKPVVRLLGVKHSLVLAMTSFSVFVGFFSLSLLSPNLASVLYILGACIGGLGEGLFWTCQGIYYSMNSMEYAQSSSLEVTKVMSLFSSIFAVLFLSIEAFNKILSTALLSIVIASASDSSANFWRVALFAMYTTMAILSVVFTQWKIIPFSDKKKEEENDDEIVTIELRKRRGQSSSVAKNQSYSAVGASSSSSALVGDLFSLSQLLHDSRAVSVALCSNRLLQYVTPFQLAFGLNGVFMDSYVCAVIVKTYIGEQYIGVMSGLLSISSVLVTAPYYYLSYYVCNGKYYVMMFGSICFAATALPFLLVSDATIGHWWFVSWLFIIHGCARGSWENTNKAVLGEYFALGSVAGEVTANALNASSHHSVVAGSEQTTSQEISSSAANSSMRDTAFASACFTSAIGGAVGYLMFGYVNRTVLAAFNVAVGSAAAVCFHLSHRYHRSHKAQHDTVYSSVDNSHSSL